MSFGLFIDNRLLTFFSLLQLKSLMELDSAMTEDLIAYNIIPLDAPSLTNAIMSLLEVRKLFYVVY